MSVLSALVLGDVVARDDAVFTVNTQFFGDLAYAVDSVGMTFDG